MGISTLYAREPTKQKTMEGAIMVVKFDDKRNKEIADNDVSVIT